MNRENYPKYIYSGCRKEHIMSTRYLTASTVAESSAKRARLVPPVSERIMIYVRQETEVSALLHLFSTY